MKKLRVAFLVDTLEPDIYTNELIEFVDNSDFFARPTIITGYGNEYRNSKIQQLKSRLGQGPRSFVQQITKSLLYRLIRKIELKHVRKTYPNYRRNEKIKNLNNFDIVNVQGLWSKSKLYVEFSERDIEKIADFNLDCIIRCGSGILKGGILSVSKFGVFSFHHGDNRVNRGGPSGFWEVLNKDPSSGFIIQKLNNELDGGEILVRGNLMTRDLWFLNNASLLAKANIFMKKLLLHIAVNAEVPQSEGVRLHGKILYKLNSNSVLLKYIIKTLVPKIFSSLSSKFFSPIVTRWSVAYAHHEGFSKSLWRYNEIKNPPGRFLADPFVFEHDGAHFIFVEDLFYSDNKGRISVIRLGDDGHEFLGVVLEEDFHLSFPYIFKVDDNIFMIPESCSNSDIRLYKSTDFPNKWEFHMQLMSGVDAADTMVVKFGDTWFMFSNICSAGVGDHHAELHVFYSDHFPSNQWQEINSGNPVIFDPQKGRNAGLFWHKGILYRVNQVHGHAHYGKGFKVNEVIELSKDRYSENEVSCVYPDYKDGLVSTHHFSATPTVAVVDFARRHRKSIALKD